SISSPALYYTDPRARSEVRPDHAQQHVKRKCPHQHGEGQRPKPRRPAPEPSQPAAREGNGDRSQRRKEIPPLRLEVLHVETQEGRKHEERVEAQEPGPLAGKRRRKGGYPRSG